MEMGGEPRRQVLQAALQSWRIAEDHAPRPDFAVACQNHADGSMDPGGCGVGGSGAIGDILFRELNAPKLDRLVGTLRSIGFALRGVHEPKRAILFNKTVAPPTRSSGDGLPIAVRANTGGRGIPRLVACAGIEMGITSPRPKRPIRF